MVGGSQWCRGSHLLDWAFRVSGCPAAPDSVSLPGHGLAPYHTAGSLLGIPRGLSPGLQQHKAALGCSCCLPSGAQLFSAAPPCTTTWAALHPSCWPLRPKRAGKWGRPPQPPPVACPEWRPYSPASQEPTASFELGEGPQVEVMQSQSLNLPGFPTLALHQQEPPSLHILGP